jgi:integrase
MASLHKDPRNKSPYWYCAYVLPDGQRAFRSTKQRDRKKAFDVCRAWEKASQKAREGELTEVQTRKVLDDILENIGARTLRSESVRSFAASWLASKQLVISAPAHRHYQKICERFLNSLGVRADRSLQGVTPADVAAYRDQRLKLDRVSHGTLGADLKTIRSLFASARRQGLILFNPAEAVELPSIKSLEREVFTPSEILALLAVAPGEWRTLILCGYYLGGRLGDMARLSWNAVDLATGVISFTQAKTGGRVQVPIHPELEEHLLAMAGEQQGALCPTLARTRTDGLHGLSNQFGKVMNQAGIDQHKVSVGRNKFSRKSYHCLRTSFSTNMANAGVSPELRMKLTGHKSFDVHQRYTHLELEPLRAAIETLPRLDGGRL